jgi:hypothetical protein
MGTGIVLGGLAGVIGRRGSTPSFRFEGLRIRLGRSRANLRREFMFNVPYIPEASELSAAAAEKNFSLFSTNFINIKNI